MVEFRTSGGLEQISDSSEEDILRFIQDKVSRFHEHEDGSPVILKRLEEEDEIPTSEIDYDMESSTDKFSEPKRPPPRYGCNCGMVFDQKEAESGEEPASIDDTYSGKEDTGTDYKQSTDYK